jgi:hypothetical protein
MVLFNVSIGGAAGICSQPSVATSPAALFFVQIKSIAHEF